MRFCSAAENSMSHGFVCLSLGKTMQVFLTILTYSVMISPIGIVFNNRYSSPSTVLACRELSFCFFAVDGSEAPTSFNRSTAQN